MSEAPDGMHPTTWRTLRALRAGTPLSRNKHFYLFKDPRVHAAVKLHRYLESVARDVRAQQNELEVAVVVDRGRYALRIDFPVMHGHRTAYLQPFELKLLAEQAPEVARVLAEGLDGPLPTDEAG